MSDNGFGRAQMEYDNQEPPDNTTSNGREYLGEMTPKAQLDLCVEFLTGKDEVLEEFYQYLFDKVFVEKPDWIRSYCESLTGFWDFVG